MNLSYFIMFIKSFLGAMLSPISGMILSADHWAKGRVGGYVAPYSLKGCVRAVTDRLTPFTHTTHRLAFCLTATYGRTLSKAAEDFVQVVSCKLCVCVCVCVGGCLCVSLSVWVCVCVFHSIMLFFMQHLLFFS